MNFTKIHNSAGTGYMQQLAPVEQKIFQLYHEKIELWRKRGINLQQLKELNSTMEKMVEEAYRGITSY